jgi:hypothetical protein
MLMTTQALRQLVPGTLLALLLAAPAFAGPPAAIPDAGRERAGRAFETFASEWMAKMEKAERNNRRQPKAASNGGGRHFTYRGYGSDFKTELKPTGHPAAPYVGLLRYREELYTCSDKATKDCSVATHTPVTEIFRFQNGRWIY